MTNTKMSVNASYQLFTDISVYIALYKLFLSITLQHLTLAYSPYILTVACKILPQNDHYKLITESPPTQYLLIKMV